MARTVTARTAIRSGDTVVVNTVTNDARTAEGGTRKIAIGDRHPLVNALADIPAGQQGPVEDLPKRATSRR
jgi:predicted RecA/RadA family phage recombinase